MRTEVGNQEGLDEGTSEGEEGAKKGQRRAETETPITGRSKEGRQAEDEGKQAGAVHDLYVPKRQTTRNRKRYSLRAEAL